MISIKKGSCPSLPRERTDPPLARPPAPRSRPPPHQCLAPAKRLSARRQPSSSPVHHARSHPVSPLPLCSPPGAALNQLQHRHDAPGHGLAQPHPSPSPLRHQPARPPPVRATTTAPNALCQPSSSSHRPVSLHTRGPARAPAVSPPPLHTGSLSTAASLCPASTSLRY
ncbi:hypothetical protein J5N97_022410 [Dioscorea zingiberensis]|uniref:Uncharacterized protein n=1 Tax=Dioscorea zingiberensis TaxID=325984 RepID=A0A9D5CB57_9LILI|nr:hypothetical protein J5N97_022410 [Dioscorea zingiberensis]